MIRLRLFFVLALIGCGGLDELEPPANRASQGAQHPASGSIDVVLEYEEAPPLETRSHVIYGPQVRAVVQARSPGALSSTSTCGVLEELGDDGGWESWGIEIPPGADPCLVTVTTRSPRGASRSTTIEIDDEPPEVRPP